MNHIGLPLATLIAVLAMCVPTKPVPKARYNIGIIDVNEQEPL
jgi:hypothetical protein